MGSNRNKTVTEKRSYIIETLAGFELDLPEAVSKSLDEAKEIIVSDYLDQLLIPLIPKLLTGQDSSDRLEALLLLYFSGDLSHKAWDSIMKQKQGEGGPITYATGDYKLGKPLEIAARYGNLAVLQKLDEIYQQELPRFPAYRHAVHWSIRQALLAIPNSNELDALQKEHVYDFLLTMLVKHATLIDASSTQRGFLNKKLIYNYNRDNYNRSLFFVNSGETLLVDALADIFVGHVLYGQASECDRVSYYVWRQGAKEDYNAFKARVLELLRDGCSAGDHQMVCDIFQFLEMEQEQKSDDEAEGVFDGIEMEQEQESDDEVEDDFIKIEEEQKSAEGVEKQKNLYLQAYKDQEYQHAWRRYLGRAAALVAAIVPPISLVFTIYSFRNDANQKAKPLWRKIIEGLFFAIIPLASGVSSWHIVGKAEVRRLAQDPIQKISVEQGQYMEEKMSLRARKREMPHINWTELKKEQAVIGKPRKVRLGSYLYMDGPQMQRRDALLLGSKSLNTDFFRRSYQASAAIAKGLQEKSKVIQLPNKTQNAR